MNQLTQDTEKVYKGFTRAELQETFQQICDPVNWKREIKAVFLDKDWEAVSRIVIASIEFFTGSQVMVKYLKRRRGGRYVLVYAPGYYKSVGA